MAQCTNCGNSLRDESKFCAKCGARCDGLDRDAFDRAKSGPELSEPELCRGCGRTLVPNMQCCWACGRARVTADAPVTVIAAPPVPSLPEHPNTNRRRLMVALSSTLSILGLVALTYAVVEHNGTQPDQAPATVNAPIQGAPAKQSNSSGVRESVKRTRPILPSGSVGRDVSASHQSGQLRSAVQPSFDCGRAKTPTEQQICADADLATLERSMVSAYNGVLGRLTPDQKGPFLREHFAWFKDYARTCNARSDPNERRDCIARYLVGRRQQLETR